MTDGATDLSWCSEIARTLSETRESRASHRTSWSTTVTTGLAHLHEVFKAEGIRILRTPCERPEPMPMPSVSFGPFQSSPSTGSSF